ncbi:MAG: hypothetical protein IPP53_07690 [Bacteroidetes bacterium]|nr:hypothetical protein [Bacteroidota bacterium]
MEISNKAKFILFILSLFFFQITTAQIFKLDSIKNFIVESTKLNAKIDYYIVNDTLNGLYDANFICVDNVLYPTLFSKEKLKDFLILGKISLLGEIKNKLVIYKNQEINVKYIEIRNTNILFLLKPNELYIVEFYGEMDSFFEQKNRVFNHNSNNSKIDYCRVIFQLETFFGKFEKDAFDDRKLCESASNLDLNVNEESRFFIYKIPVQNFNLKYQ